MGTDLSVASTNIADSSRREDRKLGEKLSGCFIEVFSIVYAHEKSLFGCDALEQVYQCASSCRCGNRLLLIRRPRLSATILC